MADNKEQLIPPTQTTSLQNAPTTPQPSMPPTLTQEPSDMPNCNVFSNTGNVSLTEFHQWSRHLNLPSVLPSGVVSALRLGRYLTPGSTAHSNDDEDSDSDSDTDDSEDDIPDLIEMSTTDDDTDDDEEGSGARLQNDGGANTSLHWAHISIM